jgi:hypothetical protein
MTRWRSLWFAELLTAALLTTIGAAVLVATARMRVGFAAEFQPRLFPSLIGWLLIVSGVALTAAAARKPADAAVDWPEAQNARRVGVMLLSIAVYLVAIDTIGMPLATMLVVWFQVRLLGGYRPHVSIGIAVASGIVVHVVFTEGLGLMFPPGLFDR